MSKLTLDSVEWGEFFIGGLDGLFNVIGTKTTHPSILEIGGTIPRVTCSATNNAIDDFYHNEATEEGGVLTVDSATIGYVSYQLNDFIATDHVEKIVSKKNKISKYVGLFLKTCIDNSKIGKYGYGYKFSQKRIVRQKILLPVDFKGKPNWQFMENYIKQEMKVQSSKVASYYENKLMKLGFELLDLDVKWKEFWMEDILDIKSGVRLTKADQIDGNIPFIGASDANNGVTEFVGNTNKSLDSNVLGVNYNGSVVENFYHSYECIFSDDVKRIKFKNGEYGDEFTYLFLKQMILSQKNKYQYGYKFNAKRMSRQKIMLPIDKNGEPHWKYMSNFIKKLEKENIEKTLNHIYIYIS